MSGRSQRSWIHDELQRLLGGSAIGLDECSWHEDEAIEVALAELKRIGGGVGRSRR